MKGLSSQASEQEERERDENTKQFSNTLPKKFTHQKTDDEKPKNFQPKNFQPKNLSEQQHTKEDQQSQPGVEAVSFKTSAVGRTSAWRRARSMSLDLPSRRRTISKMEYTADHRPDRSGHRNFTLSQKLDVDLVKYTVVV